MSTVDENIILRQIDGWACVKGCGACCKLGPLESRPDLSTYLTPKEFRQYKSMIGSDDWCINFDKINRKCNIYETRPEFCRVDPQKYKTMFDVEEEEMNSFCSFCCREQISDVYGKFSTEMKVFDEVNLKLNPEDTDDAEEVYETIDIDPNDITGKPSETD